MSDQAEWPFVIGQARWSKHYKSSTVRVLHRATCSAPAVAHASPIKMAAIARTNLVQTIDDRTVLVGRYSVVVACTRCRPDITGVWATARKALELTTAGEE